MIDQSSYLAKLKCIEVYRLYLLDDSVVWNQEVGQNPFQLCSSHIKEFYKPRGVAIALLEKIVTQSINVMGVALSN